MNTNLNGLMAVGMLSLIMITGCTNTMASSVNSNQSNTPLIKTSYDTPTFDLYGTTVTTFNKDNYVYRNNYLYVNKHIPYSFSPSVNRKYIYIPTKYSTYVTPKDKPNALIYDSYNDALFITEALQTSQQILSTSTLKNNENIPLSINRAINALSENYILEKGPTREGAFINEVRNRRQPFVSTRYTLISKGYKPSVSTIRDQIMAGFYGFGVNPSVGIKSTLGQHVFYVDVSIFSDGRPTSAVHSLFSVHGVNLNVKKAEYKWIDEHEPYITGMKFMQY